MNFYCGRWKRKKDEISITKNKGDVTFTVVT